MRQSKKRWMKLEVKSGVIAFLWATYFWVLIWFMYEIIVGV